MMAMVFDHVPDDDGDGDDYTLGPICGQLCYIVWRALKILCRQSRLLIAALPKETSLA